MSVVDAGVLPPGMVGVKMDEMGGKIFMCLTGSICKLLLGSSALTL